MNFRASGIGALMTFERGAVITAKQLETLKQLEEKPKRTEKQEETLKALIAKRDSKPELSPTAKTFVEDTWLADTYGYRPQLKSKYIQKGLYNEEKSISLLTEVTGVWYAKNSERKTANHVTGECDLIGEQHIVDIKTSWDLRTFFNSEMSTLYEWQLRSYMELYDKPYARLAYCLLDCPDELFLSEQNSIYYKYQKWAGEGFEAIEEVHDSYVREMEQLKMNLKIEERIPKESRVKTFTIERDAEKWAFMVEQIEKAKEYYNTLKL